jgi:hypothetical protein
MRSGKMISGQVTMDLVRLYSVIYTALKISHLVTAICGCTSLMGPALGGGHGWNQGR